MTPRIGPMPKKDRTIDRVEEHLARSRELGKEMNRAAEQAIASLRRAAAELRRASAR